MKKYFSKISIAMLSMVVILGAGFLMPSLGTTTGTNVVAYADSAQSIFDQMQGSNDSVLGSDVKKKVLNLSKDIQELVLSVVIGMLTVSTIFTSIKFNGAGDDASAKSKLKSALIYQVLGIAFVASVLGLVKFGLINLNLF